MMRSLVLASAAMLAVASGFAVSAAQPSILPLLPLLPLSERDQTSTRETGCTCTFNRGRATLVQMIGKELMIRTSAGRQVCRITDEQFGVLSGARGNATCGGYRLTLRRTGPVREHPEADSAESPASVTVTLGRTSRVLTGNWGCAC